MTERKFEIMENDIGNWKIHFDVTAKDIGGVSPAPTSLTVNFTKGEYLKEEEIENLKQDLKDLGKLREYKKSKENIDL